MSKPTKEQMLNRWDGKIEFNLCPFCGSNLVGICDSTANTGFIWAMCLNCHARGPTRKTLREAVDGWNSDKGPGVTEEWIRQRVDSIFDSDWITPNLNRRDYLTDRLKGILREAGVRIKEKP